MGARAYSVLEQFSDFLPGECVLEIGSERGEGSTKWLAAFCAQHKIPFHTVDVDPVVYANAVALLRRFKDCTAHNERGEDLLANGFVEKIRFAYLDGFDCIPAGLAREPFIDFHRKRYRELGLSLSNRDSQASHLIQASLVDLHSASRCAILIDDTEKTRRGWSGKGTLALPCLASRGYQISDLGGAALAVRD